MKKGTVWVLALLLAVAILGCGEKNTGPEPGTPVHTFYQAVLEAQPEGLEELVEMNVRKELELYDVFRGVVTGPMETEAVVTAFMQALGLGKKAVESPLMRHTAEMRVDALVNAGEYRREGNLIIPV